MNDKSSNIWHFYGIPAAFTGSFRALIEPYPHQVISQQLLKREEESVTAFFFDQKEGISTDIQHQDILYIVQEGQALILTDDSRHTLTGGECIFVPGGCPHSIDALTALRLVQISVGAVPAEDNKGGSFMEQKDYIKNIDKASVKTLSHLVDYQLGKIASLTLVQRPLFTTTLMAMDQGCGVGPHICEGDAMVVALDGEGEVTIGDARHTVKKDECIVMPAGISHAVKGETGQFKMMLIVSKPEA